MSETKTTIAELYQHGTDKVGEIEIPDQFPNLPDILIIAGSYYRNVTLYQEPGRATYWTATMRQIHCPREQSSLCIWPKCSSNYPELCLAPNPPETT